MGTGRFHNSLLAKTLTIGLLTLLLLVPLMLVRNLIDERVEMRDQVINKVAGGWGGIQLLAPPILTVPFETERQGNDRVVRSTNYYRILANRVRMEGELKPQMRHVGIYSVPVYELAVKMTGQFSPDSLQELKAFAETPGRTIQWDKASVFVAIEDPNGIRRVGLARLGAQDLELEPGNYDALAGVNAPARVDLLREGKDLDFVFDLVIAGSESLRMLPLAKTTEVALKSPWEDPSFSGTYTPAEYTIDKKGFSAKWQVLELNRKFPQHWLDDTYASPSLRQASFGVDLFQSVDVYQRTERATKYAILFIALTFMSVFLWEVTTGMRIHPMQYLLVGLALSVFYLLLLALSEHLAFGAAYSAGATALTMLIGIYLGGAMRNRFAGAIAGVIVGTVYGLLYLLILSEQYALLLGAIVLFLTLAAIMLFTRRYDWHTFGSGKEPKDD